ncbi:hypothetical protein CABS02_00904 [Colletotrichum abscissum]|uniref:Uncharacterized protein n=1 Tax=Colletotrichum abscissum TaxID=1671311 RepID=A0A9P9XRV7_9PEZI|nr:hypothetical protein CABS02_00904 [Colletotrichum abscissum]
MPAFQPPKMTYEKNKAWRRIAKADFHDPKMIWGDYWRRFNTIAVPLLDEDAYFADIIAAAKHAENRGHLEELLAAKHEERRRDLDNFIRDIALSSITSRQHFLSTNTRDAALKIGQTGSMDSFIQFVCGVIFGWSRAEDKQLMRVTTAGDTSTVGNGPDARYDGDVRDDISEDGGDPWEYENTFPPELCSSPGSDEQVDNPWSQTLQRGTICHDTDKTTSEHQSQPLPSMGAYDAKSVLLAGAKEEKEGDSVERSPESINTPPKSPITPRSPSGLRPTSPRPMDGLSTVAATPLSKDSRSSTSPCPVQTTSPCTSRSSPELSYAQVVDKSNSPTRTSMPAESGDKKQAGRYARGGSGAIGRCSTRKRSFAHESDEETVDEEYHRRKRRVTTGDSPVRSSRPVFPAGTDASTSEWRYEDTGRRA